MRIAEKTIAAEMRSRSQSDPRNPTSSPITPKPAVESPSTGQKSTRLFGGKRQTSKAPKHPPKSGVNIITNNAARLTLVIRNGQPVFRHRMHRLLGADRVTLLTSFRHPKFLHHAIIDSAKILHAYAVLNDSQIGTQCSIDLLNQPLGDSRDDCMLRLKTVAANHSQFPCRNA